MTTDAATILATRTSPQVGQRRARRLAQYEAVLQKHRQGVSVSAIARAQRLDRKTVRGWLQAGAFPERRKRPPTAGKLDPYRAYLQQRWQEGCRNGTHLLAEITKLGYAGRASILRKLLTQWRQSTPVVAPVCEAPPSPRCVRAWMMGTAYRSSYDAYYQRQFVECLCQRHPVIDTSRALACDFSSMTREHRHSDLAGWLKKAKASGIRELRSFADGLERDMGAVMAALATPYSNGVVEGHINRLKMLKRQMYGRAGLALLQIRVLYRSKPP